MSDSHGFRSQASLVLAIVNARVWTADPRRPWADAIMVRGTIIEAVGGSAELRKRAGAAALVVDAQGRIVRPSDANGRLVAGAPATLAIVEGPRPALTAHDAEHAEIVLSLVEGRVVVDRDALIA